MQIFVNQNFKRNNCLEKRDVSVIVERANVAPCRSPRPCTDFRIRFPICSTGSACGWANCSRGASPAYDVTLPMYRVMAALWENGDQRLSDLAAVTTTEISTLSRLVGEMKRKGLVTRSRLEDNGRTVAINLTQRANAAGRADADRHPFRRGRGARFPSKNISGLKTVLAKSTRA